MIKIVMALFVVIITSGIANAVVLTFEGLTNEEEVLNYYNGGYGRYSFGYCPYGSGPGANYGVSFSPNALALISERFGGDGNFSGNPSGDTVLYFLNGTGDIMNVAAGFNNGFSFYYADQIGFTGTVKVFSGLNGTGALLASLLLPSTPNPYTVWNPIGVSFLGTAKSVDFGGTANYIAFDDITLGSKIPDNDPIPEPGTMALFGAGLLGLAIYSKRRVNSW
jgi:hypothetical protein